MIYPPSFSGKNKAPVYETGASRDRNKIKQTIPKTKASDSVSLSSLSGESTPSVHLSDGEDFYVQKVLNHKRDKIGRAELKVQHLQKKIQEAIAKMSSVADTARTKYQEANAIDFQTYTASTGKEGTPKSRRQKLTKEEKRQNHIQSERVRRGRAKRQEEAREKYLTEKKFDLKSLWPSDIPKIDPTPSQGDKLTDEEKRQRHNLSEQNRRNRRNGYLNNLFSKAAELGYKSDSETVNTTSRVLKKSLEGRGFSEDNQ